MSLRVNRGHTRQSPPYSQQVTKKVAAKRVGKLQSLPTESGEFGASVGQAGVGELLALGQRGGEASAGQVEFAEPGVGDPAEVRG